MLYEKKDMQSNNMTVDVNIFLVVKSVIEAIITIIVKPIYFIRNKYVRDKFLHWNYIVAEKVSKLSSSGIRIFSSFLLISLDFIKLHLVLIQKGIMLQP